MCNIGNEDRGICNKCIKIRRILILDKVPELKQATIKARYYQGHSSNDNLSRPLFDQVLNQDLLESLGVPCISSSGEAEALCGFFCAKALFLGCDFVEGVPGIGQKTALELIEELEIGDLL
ncbi:hypothetical protein TNIN_459981 [Trichonephila inaurata madagascariensis]|uniref:Uncharacterized protein n=1 Tax=Trichonephila inaurata madagascariensis TaxID=2747483 RepID=A0A8X6X7E1_9ARAC|nr:hypothetical protein TNIN_459981 [Trichonephila inaurata madagascariensis]